MLPPPPTADSFRVDTNFDSGCQTVLSKQLRPERHLAATLGHWRGIAGDNFKTKEPNVYFIFVIDNIFTV